ncbi:MAG: hypothetical protein LKF36_11025 [Lactobacillus sp.]|nr:hypothetical protein [Lactobacillus sp.]
MTDKKLFTDKRWQGNPDEIVIKKKAVSKEAKRKHDDFMRELDKMIKQKKGEER